MSPSIWIAIYMPIFILLFVIIPASNQNRLRSQRLNKKRGVMKMTNELLEQCINKVCNISTGSYGEHFKNVTIKAVKDNWIEIVDKKGKTDLVNADYIQKIKLV